MIKRAISSAAFAAVMAMGIGTAEAAFDPGNIIVSHVAMPAGGTTSVAGTVTLHEYTPAGSLVGTYPVPTSGSLALTQKLSATTEGGLSLSPDGRYVSFAGYRADVGSLNPATAAVPRVIGRLDLTTGTINTDTSFTAFTGDSVRGAATPNGTDYWVSGSGTANDGGLRYVDGSGFGTATTTVGVNNPATTGNSNDRQTKIFGGQLYVSSGAGRPGNGVHQVGTGLPTTDGQTYTNITGGTNGLVNDFFFADLSPAVAGFDTLYTAGNTLLAKYTFDGTAWTSSGTVAADVIFIDGATSGGSVTIYGTNTVAGATTDLKTYTDTSGYGQALTAGAFAQLPGQVSSGTGEHLRGVVVIPIPEPGALSLLAAGGLFIMRRRTRA